ncbi:MAG: hypothetical protein LBG83_03615 [Oscillospiraceae bacterium]|jgi:hypothetical protein|nr:hypothetical protein [Oscillospiraceae bacterium]
MKFSDFSKTVFSEFSTPSNQGWFIGELFHAAGNTTSFAEHPGYGLDGYHVKVFNGSKPINKKMKSNFPRPIDRDNLTAYFLKRIGDEALPRLMSGFGINTDAEQNKDLFSAALSTQFERFITELSDDVEDVVAKTYLGLLSGTAYDIALPLSTPAMTTPLRATTRRYARPLARMKNSPRSGQSRTTAQ